VIDDGQTVLRWDEDKEGHGCHQSGLVGAVDNSFGYIGIGGSDIFITRALDDDKKATVSQTMAALDQCVNAGASIIVLSFGCTKCRDLLDESYFRSLADKGIMIFGASGNIGPASEPLYPSSFPGSVISVRYVTLSRSYYQ
jgi:subtilisin family serine protease